MRFVFSDCWLWLWLVYGFGFSRRGVRGRCGVLVAFRFNDVG